MRRPEAPAVHGFLKRTAETLPEAWSAARPEKSRLDKSKLVQAGFKPLPDWKDAVTRYLKEADI